VELPPVNGGNWGGIGWRKVPPLRSPGAPGFEAPVEAPGAAGGAVEAPGAAAGGGARILGTVARWGGPPLFILAAGATIAGGSYLMSQEERRQRTVVRVHRHLVDLVNSANDSLRQQIRSGNFDQIARVRPKSLEAAMRIAEYNPGLALALYYMAYGKTLERIVAENVARDPSLAPYLKYTADLPNSPDFIGQYELGGLLFDITTPRDVMRHLTRRYGENMIILPYEPETLLFTGPAPVLTPIPNATGPFFGEDL
jgi:hypothetical protein